MAGVFCLPADRFNNYDRENECDRKQTDVLKPEHDESAGTGAFVNVVNQVCRFHSFWHLHLRSPFLANDRRISPAFPVGNESGKRFLLCLGMSGKTYTQDIEESS
jgi:hypothetical protein